MKLGKRLAERTEGYRDEMIDFQTELTALPALGPENGGDGEVESASFLEVRLRSFGIDSIERYDAPDDRVSAGHRPNLVARLPGSSERTIWVLTHLDTVPPGDLELWDGDPWTVRIEDGVLVGRGVEDNQQGLTASVFAARAIVEEGIVPPLDIGLIFVSDEETGNTYGIDYLLGEVPDLVKPEDLVVVPDFGTSTGSLIEVAEKSVLWCRLTVHGRQVHASTPDMGLNAHRTAAHLVVRLDRDLPLIFGDADELFDPVRSTFEPTKREANVPNVNTIPGLERLFFDCRVLPHYPLEQVKAAIEDTARQVAEEFGAEVTVEYPVDLSAAPATSVDSSVVRALADAIRSAVGVEARPGGVGGGTVAASFRAKGIPAAVWATIDGTAHQPNEYCRVENLIGDAKVFAHLFAGCRE